MGYTHYFHQQRDCPADAFAKLCNAVPTLILNSGVDVAYEYDEPNRLPVYDAGDGLIRFNGIEGDGHETFMLTREREPAPKHNADMHGFSFCKTAQKPYDVLVCAALILAHYYARGVWRITSDGSAHEWDDGLALARTIEPKARCPIGGA